jgi:hypothetical protein
MTHEILEEVWRNRDALARRHNYDLDSLVAELREMERQPWTAVVSREQQASEERGPQPPCGLVGSE